MTKPIKNFSRYRVSDTGRVFSVRKDGTLREIAQSVDTSGYLKVTLRDNSKRPHTKSVHRLVAEAFVVSDDEEYTVVDHIDEDKHNNCSDNLRWCTVEMNNEYYRTKDGRDYQARLRNRHKKHIKELFVRLRQEIKYNESLHNKVISIRKELEDDIEKFEEYKKKEYAKIKTLNKNANKYTDKSVSRDKYLHNISKTIKVNGVEFSSMSEAAKFIVNNVKSLDYVPKVATIHKELKRFNQGKRGAWRMYGEFNIS